MKSFPIIILALILLTSCTIENAASGLPINRTQPINSSRSEEYNKLYQEFQEILSKNNWLDQVHYDRILIDIENLEQKGEDVSFFIDNLPELKVIRETTDNQNDYN
jgi:hypothetical protein